MRRARRTLLRLATVGAVAVCLPATATWSSAAGTRAAAPVPSSISLRAADLPGFHSVDPSVETFRDSNDQGPDEAFIKCARGVPLLSEFDTGGQATVSPAYGQGQTALGAPALSAASAVFTDGSRAAAESAYSALASSPFAACWARTMDSLNRSEGVAVPVRPTTVAPLTVPPYGLGSTGFAMNVDYAALGSSLVGTYQFSVIHTETVVTMLITIGYNATFPDSTRLAALAAIAMRMAAARGTASPSAGKTACTPLMPRFPGALLDTAQVTATVAHAVTYAGWKDQPAAGSASLATRICEWDESHASPPVGVYLNVSEPTTPSLAKAQFDADRALWASTTPVAGLGAGAFYQPYQDTAQGLEVLTDERVLVISIEAPQSQLANSKRLELALARLALARLGGSGPTTSPTTSPSPSESEPHCGASVSAGVKLFEPLDDQLKAAANSSYPIRFLQLGIPATSLNLAVLPAFEPGTFRVCLVGLAGTELHVPFSDADSTVAFTVSGAAHYGPFEYSSLLAQWTQLDSATPRDQKFTTHFNQTVDWTGPGLGFAVGKRPTATLTLGSITLLSDQVDLALVDHGGVGATAEVGPKLSLAIQVVKDSYLRDLGDDLAEGESQEAAANQEAQQVADDAAAAVDTEEEGYYEVTVIQIKMRVLVTEIESDIAAGNLAELDSLTAGSPDAKILEDDGVGVADDVPATAADALEADSASASLIGVLACDAEFGGPEDLVGDVACFAGK